MVAVAGGCQLLVEQPSGSIMLQFPYWRFFAVMITPKPWDTVRFPMGAYGHPNKKNTLLFGTATWIKKLYRKLTAKDKLRLQANKAVAKYQMVKKNNFEDNWKDFGVRVKRNKSLAFSRGPKGCHGFTPQKQGTLPGKGN